MIKLMIGTPVHSDLKVDYVKSLLNTIHLAQPRNISIHPYFPKSSAIHQARNMLLAIFLKNREFTHLLFIDSDISFSAESIFRLLSHDKEFSGICYRAKGDSLKAYNVYSSDASQRCPKTGMIKVDGMGGGFMLLKRSVIEKMVEGYPELKCLGFPRLSNNQEDMNKYYYNLFDWGINERTNYILSEDFTFCHRWRKLGGEVWVDTEQVIGHVGEKVYTGKLRDNIVDKKIVVTRPKDA